MDVGGAGGGTSVLGVRGLDSASLSDTWRGALGPAVTLPGKRPLSQEADKPLYTSCPAGGWERGRTGRLAFGALVT